MTPKIDLPTELTKCQQAFHCLVYMLPKILTLHPSGPFDTLARLTVAAALLSDCIGNVTAYHLVDGKFDFLTKLICTPMGALIELFPCAAISVVIALHGFPATALFDAGVSNDACTAALKIFTIAI